MAKKATPKATPEPDIRKCSSTEAKFGARVMQRLMNVINEESEWGPEKDVSANASVVLSTLPVVIAHCALQFVEKGREQQWLAEIERMTLRYFLIAKSEQQAHLANQN